MDFFIGISLFLIGLCMGSFALAVVWRIRHDRNFVSERSECESCHHELAAKDLIPVLSWVWLRGRCRYCRTRLSPLLPLVELGVGLLFALSYAVWPVELAGLLEITRFGLWLTLLVGLTILFIYDAKWMLLPSLVMYCLIGLGIAYAGLGELARPEPSLWHVLKEMVLGVAALGGVYYALFMLTKGRGVGFGDVQLGVFMGLVLGWRSALLVLFLSNLLGLLYVLPGLVSGRLSAKSSVPFGPFMIVAFVIAALAGKQLITNYSALSEYLITPML